MAVRFVGDYSSDLGALADRVGARGRALAGIVDLGLPVPPGFAISDVACRRFLETGDMPGEAWEEVADAVERTIEVFARLEPQRPVLFSVRSSPSSATDSSCGTRLPSIKKPTPSSFSRNEYTA